jgi:valyl-tRNA synthetase
MLQPYPATADFARDDAAEKAIAPLKAVILATRQIRGQLDVPRSRQMPIYVATPDAAAWSVVEANRDLIGFFANVTEIESLHSAAELPPTAMQLIDGYTVHAPLASLIDDPEAELSRLAKRKTKTRAQLSQCEAKLGNQNFVANARPEVVEQERTRIADFNKEIAQIEEQERRVSQLRK